MPVPRFQQTADKPGTSGHSSHHRAHQRPERGRTDWLTIAMLNNVTKNLLALSSISLSSSLIVPRVRVRVRVKFSFMWQYYRLLNHMKG